ncbi:hypothetical protein G9A89_016211 [Geosiphon pyriformis]|nr:hypothetical protein G9A89_016211 [Geosiphon pyriformis]
MTAKQLVICLLRNDLRVHDNPVFYHACRVFGVTHILPVYCFDPRQVDLARLTDDIITTHQSPTTHYFGFERCGKWKEKFLLESVLDVKKQLQKRSSDLLIRYGKPEELIPSLVEKLSKEYRVLGVYLQKEVTDEETHVEKSLAQRLRIPLKLFTGATLFHRDDLPFDLKHLPDVFTQFRKRVEALGERMVRPLLDLPTKFPDFPDLSKLFENKFQEEIEEISINFENLISAKFHSKSVIPFLGGESSALLRLNHYLTPLTSPKGSAPISTYKKTRNNLLGTDYSTKFSPFLAFGCLSPRLIHHKIAEYERYHQGETESTYWVRFELLWRDYFRFIAEKYGNSLFFRNGFVGLQQNNMNSKQDTWIKDMNLFKKWRDGVTGIPWVDANMRELKETGFMSNRGRQNVGSFLSKDLHVDWRMGAEWFESVLVDHDVCSNYGNWQYVAGVGNDPRDDRHFNMLKQAKDYDPFGDYIRVWCPELLRVPADKIHAPWSLNRQEQEQYNCVIGIDYPEPIIMLKLWERHWKERADRKRR